MKPLNAVVCIKEFEEDVFHGGIIKEGFVYLVDSGGLKDQLILRDLETNDQIAVSKDDTFLNDHFRPFVQPENSLISQDMSAVEMIVDRIDLDRQKHKSDNKVYCCRDAVYITANDPRSACSIRTVVAHPKEWFVGDRIHVVIHNLGKEKPSNES